MKNGDFTDGVYGRVLALRRGPPLMARMIRSGKKSGGPDGIRNSVTAMKAVGGCSLITMLGLQKILAQVGYSSRRTCEDLITAGCVRVKCRLLSWDKRLIQLPNL